MYEEDMEIVWSQGYEGGNIDFIQNDVLCYICGRDVKFIERQDDKFVSTMHGGEHYPEKVFIFPGEGVSVFGVHKVQDHFAVAERGLNPVVFIYEYPDFKEITKLEGGAKLGFSHIEFSASIYIATVSTLPDFLLTLWNYYLGHKLCQVELSHMNPTSISFNPGNWRQICVTMEKELCVWTVETSDDMYLMKKKKLKLPAVTQSVTQQAERSPPSTRNSSRNTHYSMDLPKAAIAGLTGDMVDQLEDIQDTTERVKPVSHTWTPAGDIYIGCKGGQLMQIDGDSWMIFMKYNIVTENRNTTSARSNTSTQSQNRITSFDHVLIEDSLSCMVLHKNGIYCVGEDGVIRRLELTGGQVTIRETCHVGVPVCHLGVNNSYNSMVLGSSQGSIQVYTPGDPDSLYEYVDLHCGSIVDVDVLATELENVVSLRGDGEIQVWNSKTGILEASVPIGIQATCLASSPIVPLLAIGTASGHVYFLDCTSMKDLRIIDRIHLYNEPVTHLHYQHYGSFLISVAEDSHNIFLIDGSPTSSFKIIGHTSIEGVIQTVSMVTNCMSMNTRVIVAYRVIVSNVTSNASTHVTQFDITKALLTSLNNPELREMFSSLRNDFKDEALNKLTYTLREPCFGVCIAHQNMLFGLNEVSKTICMFQLPEKKPHRRDVEGWILNTFGETPGHLLPGGLVTMSPHFKWIVTQGTDGAVHITKAESMESLTKFTPHDFKFGGVVMTCFDSECRNLFTIGHDNILTCYKWADESFSGLGKDPKAVEAARARNIKLLNHKMEQERSLKEKSDWEPPSVTPRTNTSGSLSATDVNEAEDDIYSTPTPILSADSTWVEGKEREARKVEDEQYVELKKDLRVKIRDVRRTIQQMMRENESFPAIEQLNHHEFDLDIEEQTRLQAEGDQEVNRIRDEIEFDNLAKMYLKEAIKKECWDEMVVKGRSLQSFVLYLEVSNYPLRAVSKEKTVILERVRARRLLELEELRLRRDMLEIGLKTSVEDIDGNEAEEDHLMNDQISTTGSLSSDFGGYNPLFHSQFDLHSRLQKLDQIVLLEDALNNIKIKFNEQFEEVYTKKMQEIQKIREKNKRICKILKDLNLPDPVVQPELSDEERPENVLSVKDDEVTVEKYLTAEQKRQLQEEKVKEEERIRLEMGDNWRERGLDMMMGGLLEIKKEDELKKDVPIPAFMKDNRDPGDWTDEEIKMSKEYERKCAELEEEREKFRKQLETELRKLQALIQEGMLGFDDMLHQLFIRKTKSQMVIYQEELKVIRLRYSLLKEEEIETREAELNYMQETKLSAKNETAKKMMEARQQIEAFRESYDILVAEDKILDKQFKREFHDCSPLQVEHLYRLYRKRPKGHKFRTTESAQMQSNPFHNRPSSAMKEESARLAMQAFLADLDDPVNIPEGIEDTDVWERLCKLRAQKVDSEINVKQKTNVMADMMSFVTARQDEDETLKEDVDAISNEISKLKEERLRFMYNLDVQLVLKQGQVEVYQGEFVPSYLDSVLIHRSVIEDLNVKIKQLGESKICSMLTSKKSRKGIVKLEWEYKRMLMNIEDLQNKMKDITFIKVTREIQSYLRNREEYDSIKNQEIITFEQTIGLRRSQHEDQLKDKRQSMQTLTKLSKGKAGENIGLDDRLTELNVTLNERKHIDEINAETRNDTSAEKNYQKIVQRRKLVEVAKAQAQEVAVLRAEVERLRMRTFPALVQVER